MSFYLLHLFLSSHFSFGISLVLLEMKGAPGGFGSPGGGGRLMFMSTGELLGSRLK